MRRRKKSSRSDRGKETGPQGTEAPPGAAGLHRRDFFRQGMRNLLQPIAEIVGNRIERIRIPPEVLSELEPEEGRGRQGNPVDPAVEGRILRPPGAIREEHFLERCTRSGQCVAACPVQAIRPIQSDDARENGTPSIDPRVQACVVCEDLSCMKACPSGALSVLPRNRIEMGLAEIRYERCVRTTGEECQTCVEKCPLGRRAIEVPHYGARVEVKGDGCIGCGVCEMYCPTEPRAIIVRPR